MTIQTVETSVTQASPVGAVQLSLSDSSYHRLRGARVIADNDNASADVEMFVVVSRSSGPLADGDLVASQCLKRGDPMIERFSVGAGANYIEGLLIDEHSVRNEDELMDHNTYLGLRAVGLESGKTAQLHIELDFESVAKTTAREGDYLRQLVRFREIG